MKRQVDAAGRGARGQNVAVVDDPLLAHLDGAEGPEVCAETGTTPLQWLIGRRVAEAQRLLEGTDLPVELVAAQSGFGTAAALRQHFGRALSTSPSAYRRVLRGQPEPA